MAAIDIGAAWNASETETPLGTDNARSINSAEVKLMNNEFMSPRAVAEALYVSAASVVRWVKDGTIAGQRFGKRIIRIRKSEVERLLNDGRPGHVK
jgi:excisionase family DNA binding protein